MVSSDKELDFGGHYIVFMREKSKMYERLNDDKEEFHCHSLYAQLTRDSENVPTPQVQGETDCNERNMSIIMDYPTHIYIYSEDVFQVQFYIVSVDSRE